jgi:hypothetical protein
VQTAFEVVFGLFIAAMALLVAVVVRWALTRGRVASREAVSRGAASGGTASSDDEGASGGKSTGA